VFYDLQLIAIILLNSTNRLDCEMNIQYISSKVETEFIKHNLDKVETLKVSGSVKLCHCVYRGACTSSTHQAPCVYPWDISANRESNAITTVDAPVEEGHDKASLFFTE